MHDITNQKLHLKKSIGLITKGLFEKEQFYQNEPTQYPYSSTLQHGINMFFACKSLHTTAPIETVLKDANETSFLHQYANHPIAEWFYDWDETWLQEAEIKKQPYYNTGELIVFIEKHQFTLTSEGQDLLALQEPDLLNGVEQYELYHFLVQLTQSQYTAVREFIIKHPIVSATELRQFKMNFSDEPLIQSILEFSYEIIENHCYICPVCGWTLEKGKHGYHCCTPKCTQTKPLDTYLTQHTISLGNMYRLKKGVMKYTALPGMIELDIVKYCEKNSLQTSLWPEMDRYDVQIDFEDGAIWQVDAKAFQNPYHLCEKIKKDDGFPTGDYEQGFYVIPDDLAKLKSDYCKIVQATINEFSPDIKCLTFRQLKRAIKLRKEQDNA